MSFNGSVIEWINEFKYLGLTITSSLSFSKHISNIALNVSRITGSFVNLRSLVPVHVLIKLYYALVYPHLSNHIVIWGSSPESHLKHLKIRINSILRVILGVTWENGRPTTSTNDLFRQLELLKLESVFKYNIYKFLRLLLDGELLDFRDLLLSEYVTQHTYNTRNVGFRHPDLTCEVERRGLSYQLILLHETVPTHILEMNFAKSLSSFKEILFLNQ